MDLSIKFKSGFELSGDLVLFRLSVSNETPSTITDVALDLRFDENALLIKGHEPPTYRRQNRRFLLDTLQGGATKTVTIYFDRLAPLKCTEVSYNIKCKDTDGNSCYPPTEKKEISFPPNTMNGQTNIINISDSLIQKSSLFGQGDMVGGNCSLKTTTKSSVTQSSASELKNVEEKKEEEDIEQKKNKEEKPMDHIGCEGKTVLFDGIEFVEILPGEFDMGYKDCKNKYCENEIPHHTVTIKNPFYMGKYPVTQKEWKEVMGDNPSYFQKCNGFKDDDTRPVEKVSWNEVQIFIKKLNENEGTDKYRLPSEAEWEYACRAGTKTRFSHENSKLEEYAWYKKNAYGKTHPVGQKNPNPWGLYDMHGNVWEWVQDTYHDNYEARPDPSDSSAWVDNDSTSHVERGGSWYDDPRFCRSASREKNSLKYAQTNNKPEEGNNLGFRLLREI
ncbi:MAG: formylglycine-generating enzyme family protein [Methanosarcinaceae archaeon]|nr:formylglycine-generating enzyme family protein [Methanosarcinaceae archaeon]